MPHLRFLAFNEAIPHRIQQLLHDKAMFAPIWQLAAMSGVGPRTRSSRRPPKT
jgi:hypothetical protein